MTKRVVSIICLLTVCLVGWARELKHSFIDDFRAGKLTWNANYKIGYYDDGTVYTCMRNATFTSQFYNNELYYCIQLPQYDSVIVSPARVTLSELEIYLMGAVDLAISVSTDSVTWVPIGSVGSYDSKNKKWWWKSIDGNYYVSIKNLSAPDAYIRKIDYTLSDAPDPEPETCNCFPVVFE